MYIRNIYYNGRKVDLIIIYDDFDGLTFHFDDDVTGDLKDKITFNNNTVTLDTFFKYVKNRKNICNMLNYKPWSINSRSVYIIIEPSSLDMQFYDNLNIVKINKKKENHIGYTGVCGTFVYDASSTHCIPLIELFRVGTFGNAFPVLNKKTTVVCKVKDVAKYNCMMGKYIMLYPNGRYWAC